MLTLIKNGYIIDPKAKREGIFDILIEGDRIKRIDSNIIPEKSATIIDASGKTIMPGFIDLHVHLREPGYEYKETIKTGSMAAAAGGFTTICPMPNTKPATDSSEVIRWILDRAKQEAVVNVLPIGAITLGQEGLELTNMQELFEAGAVAVSEDGKSVMDTALYAEGMKLAAGNKLPVFAHCEDKSLVKSGVMNAGKKASLLGLAGISNAVEDIIVARDILLAKETGVRLHLCHCSTRDSVKMISLAKEEGIKVTGEVCPHHFALTDEDIPSDDSDYKMNPPLRSADDVEALKEGLRDGIIDVIATDHAPHSEEEKSKSMAEAPFGIVGLETAFSLSVTHLVKTGYLTPVQLVEKLSVNPAKILGIDRGSISEGCVADLVIADFDIEYTIDKNSFYSKGKNTPFHESKVIGQILYTFVAGKVVYQKSRNS
ncbi:dihydroorotase [Mobilitalea sibirica]|uniref:Dihydroorotase n=1 Tax=Mobilitalea sibirica TaxID=1462919 RepID=A0A8J7GXW4_9FIRM|nr:dihydroorotase [Mobilitalea sibirica]MBH1940164.1 dihydroorotase [Mobilitalea sibirica]